MDAIFSLSSAYNFSGLRNVTDRKSTRLNSSHTVIYTLSLHDALPIFIDKNRFHERAIKWIRHGRNFFFEFCVQFFRIEKRHRSEEHTSELQSHSDLHSFPTRRSSDLHR